jgi:hypothetical protein
MQDEPRARPVPIALSLIGQKQAIASSFNSNRNHSKLRKMEDVCLRFRHARYSRLGCGKPSVKLRIAILIEEDSIG